MRLLLDTPALLWWLSDDTRLAENARDLLADPANDILVSVVSLWEIQVKVRVRKLQADLQEILQTIETQAFTLLPLEPVHLLCLGRLPTYHRDPFDHLLIAQAIAEDVSFVSQDRHAARYPVSVVTCRP